MPTSGRSGGWGLWMPQDRPSRVSLWISPLAHDLRNVPGVRCMVHVLLRPHGCLSAVRGIHLPQNGFDMNLHRRFSNPKASCDELVRGSLGQMDKDLGFPG